MWSTSGKYAFFSFCGVPKGFTYKVMGGVLRWSLVDSARFECARRLLEAYRGLRERKIAYSTGTHKKWLLLQAAYPKKHFCNTVGDEEGNKKKRRPPNQGWVSLSSRGAFGERLERRRPINY